LISGRAVPEGTRSTRTELLSLSATNRSPFGAVRITRGAFSPDATFSMMKPGGTLGLAPSGIGAVSLKFLASLPVGGWSATVSSRRRPGLSCFQSPRAAFPFSAGPALSCDFWAVFWASALTAPASTKAAAVAIRTV